MPCAIPDGITTAGQIVVQPPAEVQVTLPPFSPTRMYRVRPSPLTRTFPTPGMLVTFSVTGASLMLDPPAVVEDAGTVVADAAADAVEVLFDELQAANVSADATAMTGIARARRPLGCAADLMLRSPPRRRMTRRTSFPS